MPGVLIGFWILLGIGSGSALMGPPKVWDGVDAQTHNKLGKPCHQEYLAWSAPRWNAMADRQTGRCEITYFAVSTCQKRVRIMIGPEEHEVDWSWTFYYSGQEDRMHVATFTFIDPESHKILAQQDVTVNCLPWSSDNYNDPLYKEDGTLRE